MAEFGTCEFCEKVAVVRIGKVPACRDHLRDARNAVQSKREEAS